MRLIDADALEPYYRLMQDNATGMKMMALPDGVVDQQPAVDAVPVVRCCDCKYYEEQDETIGTCLLTESGAFIKGYCSWAEVKEE